MPTVYHGLAHHTVVCPERVRAWEGYGYANMIDDCAACSSRVPFSEEGGEGAKATG